MEGQAIGAISAQGESVAVVCDDGTLKLFSSRGNRLWTFEGPTKLLPHISRSTEGAGYIGTVNGFLIALNRAGRELWRRKIDGPLGLIRPLAGMEGFSWRRIPQFPRLPYRERAFGVVESPSAPLIDPIIGRGRKPGDGLQPRSDRLG